MSITLTIVFRVFIVYRSSEAWWICLCAVLRRSNVTLSWPHIRLNISTWTVCTECVRCGWWYFILHEWWLLKSSYSIEYMRLCIASHQHQCPRWPEALSFCKNIYFSCSWSSIDIFEKCTINVFRRLIFKSDSFFILSYFILLGAWSYLLWVQTNENLHVMTVAFDILQICYIPG